MIYIRLSGGLGNQLFQLAAALSVQKKVNLPISFYTNHLKNYETPREFMLEKIVNNQLNYFFKAPSLFVQLVLKYRINRAFPYFFSWCITNRNIKSFSKRRFYVLDDYFQDVQQIQEGVNMVCDLINNASLNTTIINSIINNFSNKSLALHIRRGDFLNKSNISVYISLNNDYYKKGMTNFLYADKCCLFSETEIVDFAQIAETPLIQSCELNISDIDEFLLMSSFNNLIIANSTFSFWAALAAKKRNPKTTVVYPEKWLYNDKEDEVWKKNNLVFNNAN